MKFAMTFLRSTTVFILPLGLLSCSTITQVEDAIAKPLLEPTISEPVVSGTATQAPTDTNLAEANQKGISQKETGTKQADSDAAIAKTFGLAPVPPNGWEDVTETERRYFQSMGPLEYAVRLGGVPNVPIWRIRLRFNSVQEGRDPVYQVKLDHYNLSPQLYQSIVNSPAGAADPKLNNPSPHRHFDLGFIPIMNVSADWLPDATQIRASRATETERCGLGEDCNEVYGAVDQEWSDDEQGTALEAAAWASDKDLLPAQMVRALGKQAGWLRNGLWTPPGEVPEGLSPERPWVEVLVTNYAGNGGGHVAHWIERRMDDSAIAVVHRLSSLRGANGLQLTNTAYLCSRGDAAGQIRTLCP